MVKISFYSWLFWSWWNGFLPNEKMIRNRLAFILLTCCLLIWKCGPRYFFRSVKTHPRKNPLLTAVYTSPLCLYTTSGQERSEFSKNAGTSLGILAFSLLPLQNIWALRELEALYIFHLRCRGSLHCEADCLDCIVFPEYSIRLDFWPRRIEASWERTILFGLNWTADAVETPFKVPTVLLTSGRRPTLSKRSIMNSSRN